MTSRSIYRFLLRLHPTCFRKRYEEQMLWIFDESVPSRGALSLLFDAFVSLLRQWLLRSGFWRHAGRPGLSADGTVALAEVLRHKSEFLHRRAQRMYGLWLIGAIVVFLLYPLPFTSKFEVAVWTSILIGQNFRYRKRPSTDIVDRAGALVSLDLQKSNAPMVDGKRASLRVKYSSGIPKSGRVLLTLFSMNILLLLRTIVRLLKGLDPAVPGRMELVVFFAGLVALFVFWFFLRKAHARAALAIQEEIDAVGTALPLQSN